MTREEIIDMARQALKQEPREDWNSTAWVFADETLEAFAKLVAENERDACAEICDGFYLSWINIQGRYEFMGEGASECAGAIRARGNHD